MRILVVATIGFAIGLSPWAGYCDAASADDSASRGAVQLAAAGEGHGQISGFAFVDASVTSKGSKAALPQGAKVYPVGSTITGTEGCPQTPYNTDGLPVAVIDYQGPPTAGSITVTRKPARGGQFQDPPYYLNLDTGRTLQFLGPIFENGSYDVLLQYNFGQNRVQTDTAKFVLTRTSRH